MPIIFDFQTVKHLVILAAQKGFEANAKGETLDALTRNIENWFNEAREERHGRKDG